MAKAKPVPDGYHTLTPQLMLDNAPQTIDWEDMSHAEMQRRGEEFFKQPTM